jgi:hypothetical protein
LAVFYHCNDEFDDQFSSSLSLGSGSGYLSFQTILSQIQTTLVKKDSSSSSSSSSTPVFLFVFSECGRHIAVPGPADYHNSAILSTDFLKCSMITQWLGDFLDHQLNNGKNNNGIGIVNTKKDSPIPIPIPKQQVYNLHRYQ